MLELYNIGSVSMRAVYFIFSWDGRDGEIVVSKSRRGKSIGKLKFSANFDTKNIHISNLNIDEEYQRMGFGYIGIGMVKSFANRMKMVVTLFSNVEAVNFYKKCGFKSETARKRDSRVIFVDENYRSSQNMYWVPDSLKRRKKIKVYF